MIELTTGLYSFYVVSFYNERLLLRAARQESSEFVHKLAKMIQDVYDETCYGFPDYPPFDGKRYGEKDGETDAE